ncbi:spike base protein, RCAP_Rcc01079 family [Altererythrobacter lauratis]|uniref:Uncharacterized protein n=1 Tax=Alteraurantiacibacter lauratis TaxID=2054627 RepID=A0ABV7EC75_9SPHN
MTMLKDDFQAFADSPMAPATQCFAITPDDVAELPRATKAIYIGSAGDVVLRALNAADDVTFRNLAAGSVLDVRARFVRASGTTATDIVGMA